KVAAHRKSFSRAERCENSPARAARITSQMFDEQISPEHRVNARHLPHEVRIFRRQQLTFIALSPFVAMGQVKSRATRGAVHQKISVRHFNSAEVIKLVRLAEANVP